MLTQKSPTLSRSPSSKLNPQTSQRKNLPRIKSKSSINASILTKIGITSPSIAKVQNLQIEIPNSFHDIHIRNLLSKEDHSPNNLLSMDSPIKHSSTLNKKPNKSHHKLPPMLNLQDVSKFEPRFTIQGPSSKRPSLLSHRGDSPTKIEGGVSKRTLQNTNHSYDSPTLSSLQRMSLRARRDSLNQRLDFSKPKELGFSPGIKYLNEPEKSPTLLGLTTKQQSPSPPGSKLEVCGENIENSQRRKSGFFRHKWLKNRYASIDAKPTSTIREEKPLNKKRRVSGILTKELEAKYGVKFANSEETDQSPTDSVKSPMIDEISPKSPEKILTLSPKKLSESFHDDETSTNDHDEGVMKIPLEKISQEPQDSPIKNEDLFETSDADKIWSNAFKPLRSKSHSNTIEPSSHFMSAEDEIKIKGKPIVAIFSASPQTKIIQPEFMKKTGSMCFTEFWSQKESKKFMRLVQRDVKSVKIFNNKRQHESVYRPEKWREQEKIQGKIQTIRHEPHFHPRLSIADVKSPKMQTSLSKSESVKIFIPVSPRSPNSNNLFSFAGQNFNSTMSAFKNNENFMRKTGTKTPSTTKPTTAFSEFSRRTSTRYIGKANNIV